MTYLRENEFVTVRKAGSCEILWPRLAAGEFVVLVAKGISSYNYIKCDSVDDAKEAIERTLYVTLMQSFVIAVAA
jgi:hypothetical protein